METENFVKEYLKRLEINDYSEKAVDKEHLIALHIAHLTHIPFETFDLIDFKELDVSLAYIFNRLIKHQRGGVCFQLNGSFELLLRKLNYNVKMIPCCVYNVMTNAYGSCNDHLSLFVTLDDGTQLLCDVGFSRNFLTPLFFKTDCIQFATNGFFRLTKTSDEKFYQLERGYLVEPNDKLVIPSLATPETCIVDIDPSLIKWTISYRFPIDFIQRSTKLEHFKEASYHVALSPDCILNHFTICRIEKFKPFIGAYGIVGKEFVEYTVENGIETRKNLSLANMKDKELKKLLKEKFNLQIERKLSLFDI